MWSHFECVHLQVTEYSPKMWLRLQRVITVSHVAKRLEEKVSSSELAGTCFPLSVTLLVFLSELQDGCHSSKHPSSQNYIYWQKWKGCSVHHCFVVMGRNLSQESLRSFFIQSLWTGLNHTPDPRWKENIGVFQPLLKVANSASKSTGKGMVMGEQSTDRVWCAWWTQWRRSTHQLFGHLGRTPVPSGGRILESIDLRQILKSK